MLHTLFGGPASSGIQAVGPTRQKSPARCGRRGPATRQGAATMLSRTSQDAPIRWRSTIGLYSEFALRGVRVVLIEKIV
eukprot:5789065-Pyramimonas_sp.AAC.1